MTAWSILAVATAYIGLMFAIAWWGDRRAQRLPAPRFGRPVVYSLAIAVYCTSWTFMGSVGRAANSGLDFLAIYLGPIALIVLGWGLVRKVVRVAKAQAITSVADFIAARYGKSQALAALVAGFCVFGILPYIALQLKAVSQGWAFLATGLGTEVITVFGLDTALIVALAMAVFAILFGTRSLDATEHHPGLMLAIAFESVVKLAAFIAIGIFVTWGVADGLGDLAGRAAADPRLAQAIEAGGLASWLTPGILALLAFLCLPRQFHAMVVESTHDRELKVAGWMFPLYLVLINLFVVPIAMVGLYLFEGQDVDPDMFVLAVPLSEGSPTMAAIAFIGALSAATSMVVVASVALSTMVSNDVVMPVLLRFRRLGLTDRRDLASLIQIIRRGAIVGVLCAAWVMYRLIGDSHALSSIGLLSFAAVAQFAPALIGAVIWRGGTRAGAIVGLALGYVMWTYTLLVPAFIQSGWLPLSWLLEGPGGIDWLRPTALFGLEGPDALTHGVLWSLVPNVLGYILVSRWGPVRAGERLQALAFVEPYMAGPRRTDAANAITVAELSRALERFMGPARAAQAMQAVARARGHAPLPMQRADLDLIQFVERQLRAVIGAASARVVVASLAGGDALEGKGLADLLDDASTAIRYNHALLRTTMDTVSQGIVVFDPERRLVAWNHAYLRLSGLDTGQLEIGRSLFDVLKALAERGDMGAGEPAALAKRSLHRFENDPDRPIERRRPDGTVVEVRGAPMPDGGLVITLTDVTERVNTTQVLAEARDTLEQRVTERTAALTQLNAELEKARAASEEANLGKTRFLAAASHDLLQPLNAARLFSSALQQRPLDGDSRALADRIESALRSVEDLLGALLDISKLDAGAQPPDIQALPIDGLLSAMALEFGPMAQERKLKLTVLPSSLWVRSDPRLLRRILQNFMANALKYTETGKILVGCRREGTEVRIEVWDTGPGIPEDRLGEVFQEFRRLEVGEESAARGLGLGLAIVDRIARMLDHPIGVRSTLGRGTLFTVNLPRAVPRQQAAAVEPEAAAMPDDRLAGRRVLCVDNEAAILDGLEALLGGWGMVVGSARSVAQAADLATAGDAPPALIVADYHLDDGATGLEAIAAVRAAVGRPVPAVVVTADRGEAVRCAVEDAGHEITRKPVRPAALRAVMNRALLRGGNRAAAE